MVQAYGGNIVGAKAIMHGKISSVHHTSQGVFSNLNNPLNATRYHSLAILPETVPDCLEVTARSQSGVIMGIQHRGRPYHGVQFHPESIRTVCGHDLLKNFLDMAEAA